MFLQLLSVFPKKTDKDSVFSCKIKVKAQI